MKGKESLSLSSCYYFNRSAKRYNTSTSCKVANPLSPTILFICGSNGSRNMRFYAFDWHIIVVVSSQVPAFLLLKP